MKRLSLLAISSAAVLAGSANAELVFGMSVFNAAAPAPDFGAFTVALNQGFEDVVFASNNTYGGTHYTIPSANGSQWANFGGNALLITLTATADSPNPLNDLVFDAAVTGPVGTVANYTVTSPGAGAVTGSIVKGANPFVSLSASLGAILTGDVITISLQNIGASTVAIDNIGIIPEPSGALALAGLLGTGLLMRSRRKAAATEALA